MYIIYYIISLSAQVVIGHRENAETRKKKRSSTSILVLSGMVEEMEEMRQANKCLLIFIVYKSEIQNCHSTRRGPPCHISCLLRLLYIYKADSM